MSTKNGLNEDVHMRAKCASLAVVRAMGPEQDGSQSTVTLNLELSQVQRAWGPGSGQGIRG